MVSTLHEVLVEHLTETQALAQLLGVTQGVHLSELTDKDGNYSETKPVEWRGDGFLLVGSPLRRGSSSRFKRRSMKRSFTVPLAFEMARKRYPKVPGDVVLVTATELARYYDMHVIAHQGPSETRRTLDMVRVDLSRIPAAQLLRPNRWEMTVLFLAAHRTRQSPRSDPRACPGHRAIAAAFEDEYSMLFMASSERMSGERWRKPWKSTDTTCQRCRRLMSRARPAARPARRNQEEPREGRGPCRAGSCLTPSRPCSARVPRQRRAPAANRRRDRRRPPRAMARCRRDRLRPLELFADA